MTWQLAAALFAAGFSALELAMKLGKRFCLRAVPLWLARGGLDGLLGFLAYPVVTALAKGIDWYTPAAVALTAGVAAPTALRSQVVQLGKNKKIPFGPLYLYDHFRNWLDPAIEQESTAAQTAWAFDRAVPQVGQLPLEDIGTRVKAYLEGLTWERPKDLEDLKRWIDSTISEPDSPHEKKVAVIVLKLVHLGHRAQVHRLMTAGKRFSAGNRQPPANVR